MQPTHSTKLSSSQTSLQSQWVKEERSHGRSCLWVSSSSSRSGLDQISCLWQSCSCCGKTRQDFVTKLKLHKIFSYLTKMSFWDKTGCVWIKLKKMITSSQEIHQTVLIFSPDKVFWVSKFWPVLLKDNWYFQLQTAVFSVESSFVTMFVQTTGQMMSSVRLYLLPEYTAEGRQPHHGEVRY